jgi:hypothetical protein
MNPDSVYMSAAYLVHRDSFPAKSLCPEIFFALNNLNFCALIGCKTNTHYSIELCAKRCQCEKEKDGKQAFHIFLDKYGQASRQ